MSDEICGFELPHLKCYSPAGHTTPHDWQFAQFGGPGGKMFRILEATVPADQEEPRDPTRGADGVIIRTGLIRDLVLAARTLIDEAERSDCEIGRDPGIGCTDGEHGEGCPVGLLREKLKPFEALR